MMKLRVLLADDEPSALHALQYVIEKRCDNFEIVCCAENGREALEKAKLFQPDILITDIKMPLLDGIGLVEEVRQSCPETRSVIVSGYQDFEYAKGAMRSGVVDYLLKPLDIEQLTSLLEKLRLDKLVDYYDERVAIISKYIQDADPKYLEGKDIARYLAFDGYTAALVRINGLPSRFSAKSTSAWLDPGKDKKSLIDPKEFDGIWMINGRDDAEFFIFKAEGSNTPSLEQFIRLNADCFSTKYYTVILAAEPFRLCDCNHIAGTLWHVLDNRLVLGLSQIICLSKKETAIRQDSPTLDNVVENRIAYLVSGTMYEDLKQEFINLFERWEAERRSQLWVEYKIRQIIGIIVRRVSLKPEIQTEIDILLDEALSYSTTFGELLENIWQIVEEVTRNRRNKCVKIDTEDFFRLIEKYVKQNLRESLSLGEVCSHMGISQTYLSRLFRKYTNMSFNKYITIQRINEAKRLIDTAENMPIQDVAFAVGYDTPCYFSKVFREAVGMTPSEYTDKKKST